MGDEEPPKVPAGWYPAVHGVHVNRYWDGTQWTDRKPPRISGRALAWMIFCYTVALICAVYALWPYGWWPL